MAPDGSPPPGSVGTVGESTPGYPGRDLPVFLKHGSKEPPPAIAGIAEPGKSCAENAFSLNIP